MHVIRLCCSPEGETVLEMYQNISYAAQYLQKPTNCLCVVFKDEQQLDSHYILVHITYMYVHYAYYIVVL